MQTASPQEENAALQARLLELEDVLRAVRDGEVDALVIESAAGPQVYTLQGVDAESHRLRGEVLAQVSDAVIACDTEQRIIYLNTAAERLYGVPTAEALGQPLSSVYAWRWFQPDSEATATAVLRDRGEWRGESMHIGPDGRPLAVESSVTLLRGVADQPTGMLAVIRDVSDRKRHEEAVLVSEIRYRRLFEAAHDGVLLLNPETRAIIDANPFMTRLLGYTRTELIGKELHEIGLLEDAAASCDMVRKLLTSSQDRYEHVPILSRSGKHHDVEIVANLYDENGRATIQCNIRDITERRRTEEHVRQLMAEVNHRAKNLLAVVQVVAYQTAKHGDPATFSERLSERIDGLAAGQDLLVKNLWRGVEVAELVEAQLAHFKDLLGTRVLIGGSPACLTAGAAQGVGMALHELATNAAKYGALSNGEGRVVITWHVSAPPSSVFSLSWRENGGPLVTPPARRGFGQVVIGRMAEAAVQGKAEIAFPAQGLWWNLSAPTEYALAPGAVR